MGRRRRRRLLLLLLLVRREWRRKADCLFLYGLTKLDELCVYLVNPLCDGEWFV
jgi:hypothetical protein